MPNSYHFKINYSHRLGILAPQNVLGVEVAMQHTKVAHVWVAIPLVVIPRVLLKASCSYAPCKWVFSGCLSVKP